MYTAKYTGADLFSGGGGATMGMLQAGIDVRWSVEFDKDIAAAARRNFFHPIIEANILDLDERTLEPVDFLHASPPCQSFSVAKRVRGETANDVLLARKVVSIIRHVNPLAFTLENVYAYRNSESWGIIESALREMGYGVNFAHINAADYGVPQTRRRMIAWAVKGMDLECPAPTHSRKGDTLPKWNGWYAAVADLIEGLEESQLSPWQVTLLPDEIQETLLVDGTEKRFKPEYTRRTADQPALTVKASIHKGMPKGVLVSDAYAVRGGNETAARRDDEPYHTVVQSMYKQADRAVLISTARIRTGVKGSSGSTAGMPVPTVVSHSHTDKAIVPPRVVRIDARCLARFQTFPDWYTLPKSNITACRLIGNAVPPMLVRQFYEHIISALSATSFKAA